MQWSGWHNDYRTAYRVPKKKKQVYAKLVRSRLRQGGGGTKSNVEELQPNSQYKRKTL